ncbi:alpha-L-fucosidase [Algibacter mikhailovii]|uniref:alpha-L-fucosidase n=1 Tax=Algibacter mikhailovii TaxID=425498 RepID=UPI0024942729|nr:alpha-L-fucosidase [Algibacter mikhailovii]
MKRHIILTALTVLGIVLTNHSQVLKDGTIDTGDAYANAKLQQYESPDIIKKRLAWWEDARFGMFIHWGLYAHDGCHWNGQYGRSEHMMLKLKIPISEYEKIADAFNPEKFNADEWVRIAKQAGMKYMVITAKHHDGYAMFNSPSNDYNIVERSKWKRDPVKELAEVCERQGLKFGVYYSLGRDWHDPNCNSIGGRRSNLWDYPNEEEKVLEKYIEGKVKPQLGELMTQYNPAIVWFDTPEHVTKTQSLELLKLIHDINPECIVNQRVGNRLGDYAVREQKIPESGEPDPWESCMTLNHTWGYNKIDREYKSVETLIYNLTDIASKGGNFLLNVGPTGEGIIPDLSVDRLEGMGNWLAINGEAIYGTTVSHLKDFKYGKSTKRETKDSTVLYLTIFEWPKDGVMTIDEHLDIKGLSMLVSPDYEIKYQNEGETTTFFLPDVGQDPIATVLKITLN